MARARAKAAESEVAEAPEAVTREELIEALRPFATKAVQLETEQGSDYFGDRRITPSMPEAFRGLSALWARIQSETVTAEETDEE